MELLSSLPMDLPPQQGQPGQVVRVRVVGGAPLGLLTFEVGRGALLSSAVRTVALPLEYAAAIDELQTLPSSVSSGALHHPPWSALLTAIVIGLTESSSIGPRLH